MGEGFLKWDEDNPHCHSGDYLVMRHSYKWHKIIQTNSLLKILLSFKLTHCILMSVSNYALPNLLLSYTWFILNSFSCLMYHLYISSFYNNYNFSLFLGWNCLTTL